MLTCNYLFVIIVVVPRPNEPRVAAAPLFFSDENVSRSKISRATGSDVLLLGNQTLFSIYFFIFFCVLFMIRIIWFGDIQHAASTGIWEAPGSLLAIHTKSIVFKYFISGASGCFFFCSFAFTHFSWSLICTKTQRFLDILCFGQRFHFKTLHIFFLNYKVHQKNESFLFIFALSRFYIKINLLRLFLVFIFRSSSHLCEKSLVFYCIWRAFPGQFLQNFTEGLDSSDLGGPFFWEFFTYTAFFRL